MIEEAESKWEAEHCYCSNYQHQRGRSHLSTTENWALLQSYSVVTIVIGLEDASRKQHMDPLLNPQICLVWLKLLEFLLPQMRSYYPILEIPYRTLFISFLLLSHLLSENYSGWRIRSQNSTSHWLVFASLSMQLFF